jgi:cellulose synthase/poly-beta-1,6-N-acetylglucosamine synthase-like glycosyltransferase
LFASPIEEFRRLAMQGLWVVFMDAGDCVEIDYLEKMRSAFLGLRCLGLPETLE